MTIYCSKKQDRIIFLGAVLAAILMTIGTMIIAASLGGCGAKRVKNVTDLPPGVTLSEVQQWDAEVAALHKMATVTSSLRQGVIALNQAGAFPYPAAYIIALRSIAKIDQTELAASAFLRQSPQHFGAAEKLKVAGMLQDIATQLKTLNLQSLVAIKNEDTKKNVTLLVNDLTAAMNLALSFAQ